ncbi:hypothetical protein C8Q70DRAFT_934095 [Cubamyces menziesii]|nr:hypothetical protein C8Q70DRAFT_934095 [Cubamyces menziesii]
MTASPVIIVDDADPAIDYGTPDLWNHTKYVGNFYDATYSAGYTNATAKLSFNGTSVEVYVAVIQPQTQKRIEVPEAIFTLDGAPSQPVAPGLAPNSLKPVYGFNMFVSGNLSAGPHTLEITVYHADKQDGWPFILDYIQYVPLDNTVVAGGSGTVSSESSPSPTAPLLETHRGSPLGPVVGGLVGGFLMIALLAIAVYVWLRRRRRRTLAVPHCALTVSYPRQERSAKPGSQRPLGGAAARLLRNARRSSVRVYHADSGLRFGPPAARGRTEGGSPLEDVRSDDGYSEIPPQYTES